MATVRSTAASHRPGLTRVDWHARLAMIIAMAMGYTVLFAAQVYGPEYLPVIGFGMLIGYIRAFDARPGFVPDIVWTLLSLVLVAGLMVLSFTGRIFFLDALNWIFLLLPMIKLLTAKAERDYLQIYALAFGQILYGTIVNTDLSFGFVLAAYMAVTMWGLILLTFRVMATSRPGQAGLVRQIEDAIFNRRYMGLVALLPVLALLATFLLFFIIPRPGSTVMNFSFGIGKRTSGFSDSVDLGQMGEIKLDQSIAMRVKLDGAPPEHPIYWRGAGLDTFDGMTWTARKFQPLPVQPVNRLERLFVLSDAPEQRLTHQKVFLVGVDGSFLLHEGFLHRAKVYTGALLLHGNSSVTFSTRDRYIESYEAWTAPTPAVALTDELMEAFLQLPDTLDPRIIELTKQVTQGARTPMQAARRIEQYLKNEFTYSLKAGLRPSADPMATFLFDTRAGHCEYFASAMTIMLRQLGIHARYIAGYQEGEYNPIEDYYIVRQSDAHTWVEAFIDDRWVRFEPTPAAGLSAYTRDFVSDIGRLVDSFAFRWQRYIVGYTARDQIMALLQADNEINMLTSGAPTAFFKRLMEWVGGSIVGIALLLSLWRFYRWWRARQNLPPAIRRNVRLSRRFLRLAKRLKKAGIVWEPQQTPAELLQACESRYPAARIALSRWLRLYQPLRYGGRDVEALTLARMDAAETEIVRVLKAR